MSVKTHPALLLSSARVSLVCLSVLCAPATALAQDASMSDEQIVMLNTVNRELGEPEPNLERARAILEQALEVGSRFDLLLLTYGRVLQKQNKCERAQAVFDEIADAPHEPSQTREDIESIRNVYVGQMPELCEGTITILCANQDTQVTIDGEPTSCGASHRAAPGDHELAYGSEELERSRQVRIEGWEAVEVQLDYEPPTRAPQDPVKEEAVVVREVIVPAPALRPRSGLIAVGGAVAALGLGAGSAGYFIGATNEARISAGEVDQPTGRARAVLANRLLGAGVSAGVVGVGIATAGALMRRPEPTEVTWSVHVSGARLGVVRRF